MSNDNPGANNNAKSSNHGMPWFFVVGAVCALAATWVTLALV